MLTGSVYIESEKLPSNHRTIRLAVNIITRVYVDVTTPYCSVTNSLDNVIYYKTAF